MVGIGTVMVTQEPLIQAVEAVERGRLGLLPSLPMAVLVAQA